MVIEICENSFYAILDSVNGESVSASCRGNCGTCNCSCACPNCGRCGCTGSCMRPRIDESDNMDILADFFS